MSDRNDNIQLSWDSAQRILHDGLLTVVMPAYDLGSHIARNVREVYRILEGNVPFEIIVVDDGSTDATASEIRSVAATLPNVHAVVLPLNTGKGAALKRGFMAGKGSHFVLLDGDLDLPPWQISHLFEIMEKESADVVIGSKRHPESRLKYPLFRRIMSSVYYWLVKLLIRLPIHDTQTGIKLFRREPLQYALSRILIKTFAFDIEVLAIIHNHGFRIAEAPITLNFQIQWSGFPISSILSIIRDTLAVFYRLRVLDYYNSIRDLTSPVPEPRVSVVIACPGPSAYLDEALLALSWQTYQPMEVLILPDASTGRQWPANVREIITGKIRPAEKRNIGIHEARGDIIAFLDDDTWPSNEWLQCAIPYFSEPSVAAVGGPATTPPDDPFLASLSGRVFANPLVSGGYGYRYSVGRVRDVDDLPSCNLMVRADVLRALGGFRTDYWPGEDTILCMQIVKDRGERIVYDPRVHVNHHRRKLLLPHLRQAGRYGLHRGYFAKRFPATSRRISYFVPSIFVLGLILGLPASLLWAPLLPWYSGCLLFYFAVTFLAAAALNPWAWLLTWVGIVTTHCVYGTRFMQGLLASRMPGEVRFFDHTSQSNTGKEAAISDTLSVGPKP